MVTFPLLHVCRTALQPDHVRLAETKLGRVLDRDHPLGGIDERRERVEQSRLARAGPPAHQDASPRPDRRGELVVKLLGDGAQPDELLRTGPDGGEPADGERGAIDRQRRDHHVHPGAVLEPGVDHRAELVHPAAERRQDPLDRVPQRLLGRERDIGPLDPAAPLDVDLLVPIHHHLLDRGIGEQLLERPEADRLAEDQLDQAVAGRWSEDRRVLIDEDCTASGSGPSLAPPAAACARRRSTSRPRSSAASRSRCLRRMLSSTSD